MIAEGGAGAEACGRRELWVVWKNGGGGELLRFFLAEGERTRGAEEVGDGWILETARAR